MTRQVKQAQPPDATEWLTFAEFCRHIGVSTRTGRKYISQGLIPAYRLGPQYIRVRRADVEKLFTRIPTAGQFGGDAA